MCMPVCRHGDTNDETDLLNGKSANNLIALD